MSSAFQLSRLEVWVEKAIELSTNKYSLIMILGNTSMKGSHQSELLQ